MSAPFDAIPPTLEQFVVPMSVLQETRELLAGPGIEGYEAVVLWLGVIVSAIEARVLAAYLPRQITYKTRRGLAVEIPPDERTASRYPFRAAPSCWPSSTPTPVAHITPRLMLPIPISITKAPWL